MTSFVRRIVEYQRLIDMTEEMARDQEAGRSDSDAFDAHLGRLRAHIAALTVHAMTAPDLDRQE